MVVGIYGGGGGSTIVRLSSDGLPSETCQQNASFFDLILAVTFCIADDHSDDADTVQPMGEEIKAAAKDAQSYLTIDYVQFNLNQYPGFCLSFFSFFSFLLFDDEIWERYGYWCSICSDTCIYMVASDTRKQTTLRGV